MKKTLLFAAILLALFFSLTGCSGTPESTKTENSETTITHDPDPDPDTPPVGGTSTGPSSPFSVGQSANWVNMTVTLNDGITFREIEGEKDVTSWFKGLPEGVKALTVTAYTEGGSGEKTKAAVEKDGKEDESASRYIAVKEGERTLKFRFTGTVGEESSEKFALVIPSAFTSAGHDISIEIKASQSIIVDDRIKVTFDLGGGKLEGRPSTWVVNLSSAGKVDDPGTPTREGYDFVAWMKDGDSNNFNFYTTVKENITIRAVWNPIDPLPPTYEVLSSDDYETTVRVHKNNFYGMVFYTLDGKDPVADKDKCRYNNSTYFDLTVQNGTVIRALTRKSDGSGKVSGISEYRTVKVLDYYAYGVEDVSQKSDSRITSFHPGPVTYMDIGSSLVEYPDLPSGKMYGQNDIDVLKVLDADSGRLLVVAKYGVDGSKGVFYYYIDKSTGKKVSEEVVVDCGIAVKRTVDHVHKIGNALCFIGTYFNEVRAYKYDLDTNTGTTIAIDTIADALTVSITDSFTVGSWIYAVGNCSPSGSWNYTPFVWGINTADTSQTLIKKLGDDRSVTQGAGSGDNLYFIVDLKKTDGTISSVWYLKKLLTYNLSNETMTEVSLAATYANADSGKLIVGDMAVVDGELLIAGCDGPMSTGATRLYALRPCIWNSLGEQTILVESDKFPKNCGYITPHTIEVLDGKVYILTDNHYDAYVDGNNYPYTDEITHGGVIELDTKRVWDFGTGWYYGKYDTRIKYFYFKTE